MSKKNYSGWVGGWRVVVLNENITTSAPNWALVGAELGNKPLGHKQGGGGVQKDNVMWTWRGGGFWFGFNFGHVVYLQLLLLWRGFFVQIIYLETYSSNLIQKHVSELFCLKINLVFNVHADMFLKIMQNKKDFFDKTLLMFFQLISFKITILLINILNQIANQS